MSQDCNEPTYLPANLYTFLSMPLLVLTVFFYTHTCWIVFSNHSCVVTLVEVWSVVVYVHHVYDQLNWALNNFIIFQSLHLDTVTQTEAYINTEVYINAFSATTMQKYKCLHEKGSTYHEHVMVISRPVQRLLQVQPPVLWNLNVCHTFPTQPEIINTWMGHLKLWRGRWGGKKTN